MPKFSENEQEGRMKGKKEDKEGKRNGGFI